MFGKQCLTLFGPGGGGGGWSVSPDLKTDGVNTVALNLTSNQTEELFWDTWYSL